MPITPTYPGVYIEELPSGVRTITGVATSITAFIGLAKKGPLDDPVLIHSFADYTRKFGGLWENSTMSFAVQQYFNHGGKDALIVRVINLGANQEGKAAINLTADSDNFLLEAANEGHWGDTLKVKVTDNANAPSLFNLIIREYDTSGLSIISEETFLNLSIDQNNARFVRKILEQQSELVRTPVDFTPVTRPDGTDDFISTTSNGDDGGDIDNSQIADSNLESGRKGIYALNKADLFNILCITPPNSATGDVPDGTLTDASKYCKDKRAMLIVDSPSGWNDSSSVTDAATGIDSILSELGQNNTNAAIYFPRVKMANPLKAGLVEEFVPCGAIAGIWARTDAQRGVWKAPAGQEASFSGVQKFTYKLDDAQNGELNPLGVNCLRSFPVFGNLVWGSRTLAGADQLASEWKYIPVRRLALYIEETLYRGTKWVVFEPNDEPLWAQIRLNIGAFMHDLFIKGAFQGTTPRDAYFVKCDKETTTQNDIDHGIVNILVGFAPLKPAEFVMIKIQQIAGKIQT